MLGDRFATVDSADSSTYRYIKEIVGNKEDQEEYGMWVLIFFKLFAVSISVHSRILKIKLRFRRKNDSPKLTVDDARLGQAINARNSQQCILVSYHFVNTCADQ